MAMTTDPIADMLTRIRNGLTARHDTVSIPMSKIKLAIAEILKNEGYIADYEVVKEGVQDVINITLKYSTIKGQKVITGLKRISKPGLRVYASTESIPSVLNGMGIAILSTSKGVLTDKLARMSNAGGEVLAYIW
jgi:small subunit ribosomal protein S8